GPRPDPVGVQARGRAAARSRHRPNGGPARGPPRPARSQRRPANLKRANVATPNRGKRPAPQPETTPVKTTHGPADLLTSAQPLKASLDCLQANVFIAATSFTLAYASPQAMETLRDLEREVRDAFGVEVDDIVGLSIHSFHKDRRGVEKILRTPKSLPHTTM